jgi:hypothetical protein
MLRVIWVAVGLMGSAGLASAQSPEPDWVFEVGLGAHSVDDGAFVQRLDDLGYERDAWLTDFLHVNLTIGHRFRTHWTALFGVHTLGTGRFSLPNTSQSYRFFSYGWGAKIRGSLALQTTTRLYAQAGVGLASKIGAIDAWDTQLAPMLSGKVGVQFGTRSPVGWYLEGGYVHACFESNFGDAHNVGGREFTVGMRVAL